MEINKIKIKPLQWYKIINKNKTDKINIFFNINEISDDKKIIGTIIIYELDKTNNKWQWSIHYDIPLNGNIIPEVDITKKIKFNIAFHEEIIGLMYIIQDNEPEINKSLKINYTEINQPQCMHMQVKDFKKNNISTDLIDKFLKYINKAK